ncbi:unnamed protein product [Amoebophrya sp. A120]|nr:unnamed protein product [Amoebophrya sp. A120]|eukprot:GSA120T00021821001.1
MDALRHTKQDLQDLKATLIQALEDHNTEVGLDQREHVDNEEINKIQEALDKLDHIDPSNPDGDSKEWSGNIIHGAVKNKELLDNIQDITNGFKQDLDEHDGHWGQWLKTELGEEESGYLDLEAHPHTDELLKNYDFEHTAAENLEDWEKEKEHLERYQETSKEIHDLQDDITNHDATYCHERDTNSDYGEDFNYGFCMDQIDNNKMRLDDLQKQLDEQKATMPAELQHFVSDGSDKLHERLDVLNHITTLLENHPNVLEKENDPNLPDSLEYNPQGGQIMTQEYDWDQTLQENKDRWDDELARIKALPDNGSLRTSDDMKEVLGSDAPIKEHDQSESDYLDVLMQKIVIKKAALEEATTRPWTDEETSYIDSQKDRMDAADDKIAELRTSVEHMDRQHLGTLKEMEEDMREGNMDEIGAKIQADEEKEHNLRDMQTSMKTLINEVTDGDDKRALLARKEELDTAIATVRNVDKYDAKMNEYERLVSDALTEVKREHTIDAHDDLTDRHDAMKDILDGLARQTAGDSDDHERVVGWQTQLTEIQDAVDENQHPNPSQDDLDAQANKYKDLLDDIKDHVADADESAGGGNNGGHHDDNKIRIDHDNFEKLNEKHDAVERVVNDYQNVHDAEHTIGSPGDGHGAGENPEDTIFGHMEAARDSVQAIGEQQTQLYHDPRQLAASVLVGGGAWFWFGNKMYSKKYKEVLHPKKTSKKLISRGSAKRISLDLRDADQVAFDRRRNLSEEEMLKLRQQERQIAHYKQVGKLLDDKMASHGVEGYEDYSGYHYKVASDFTRLQEKLDEEGKVGRRPGLLSKVDIATLESDDNWQKVWWGPFETSMWQYVGEEMEIGTRVRLNERGELLIDEDGVLVEDWKKFTMEHNAMTSPLTRLTGQLLKWRGQSAGEIAMASERQLLASIDAEETRASWFWQAGWERDQEDDLLEQVKEKSKEALPMLLSTYYAQDSVMDPVALETQQIMEKWEEKALKDVKHLNGEDPNAENAEDGSAKMDALEAEALRPPEEWLQADPGAPESGVAPLQERLDKRAEVCSFENGRELENDKFCQLATDEVEKRKEELEKYWVTQIPKDKRMELVKQYKEQRKMKAEATKAEQGSGLLSSSSSAASSSSTAASASSFLQMSKTGERTEEQMEKNMEKHQTAREGLASGMMKVGEGGRVARRHAVAASTTSEQQEAKQEARARTGTRAAAKNKLLPASNDAGLLDEDVEESEFPKTTNALGLRADLLAHSGANSWSGRLFGGKDSTTSYRDTMFGDAFILLDPLRSYTKVDRYERGGDAGGSITSTRREGRTQAAREADATRNYFAAVGMVLPTKIREHLRFLMFLTPDECLPQPGQDTVLGYRYEMRNEGQILSDIDEERKKKERLATWNINELRQREVGSKITDHNANFLQDLTSATLEDLEDAAWGTCKDIHLSTSKLTTDKLGVSGVDGNIHPKIPLLAAEERINEYIRARRFRAEKFRDIMEDIYGDEMRYNYAFHLKTEGILQKQILKAEHLSDKVRERDIELEIQQMREQLEALEEGGDLYYHFADLDVDEDGNVITKECEPGDTECEELLRQHEEDLENQANGAAQAAAAAAASSATSSSSSAASMLQVKEQEELSTTSLVGGAVPDEAGAAKEIPEPVEKVTSSGRSATDVKTNTMSTSTTAHKLPAVAATSSAPGVQGSSQELAEPLGKLSSESSGARSSTENDALSGRGDGSSTSLGDSVLEVDTNMQAGATSSTSSQLQVGEAKTKTETARNHQKLARRTGGTSKSRSRTTSQERSLSVASSSSSSSFAEQKTAKKKELQSQLLEKVLLQKAMRQKRKRGRQRRAASSDADARKSTRSRSPDHVLEQDEHESSPPAGAQTSTSSSLLQHTVEEEQVQETKQGEEGKKTSAMKELKSRTTEREEMRLVARHRESKVPAERVQEAEEVEGELILKFMEQHKDFSQDWLAHYADNYSWETTPEQELRDDMFLNPQSNLNTRDRWTATNLLREIALVEWKKVAEYVIMVQTDQHSACGGNIGESRLYQRAGMDVRMAAGHITEHLAADLEYQQAALTETEDTPEEFKHNKYIGGDLIRGDVELPKSYLMSELHRAMEYVLVKEYTKPAKVHTLETEYQDRLLTERLKAKLGRKPSAGEVLAAEKRGTNKGLFDIFQARLLAEDVLERQVDNSDWKLKPQECGSIWKRIADAMYFEAASVYRNERNRMAHLLEEKPDIAMMVETDVTEEIENAWKHTRQTSKSMVEGEEDERDIDQYVAIKGEGEAELAFMHQIMFNKAMKVKKLSNQRYRIMKSAKYEKFLRPDLLRDSLIEDLHKEAGDTVEGVKDGIKFQRLLEKADMLDALQDVLRKAEEEYDKVKRDYELARKWDREANKWYSEQKKKDLSPMRAFWLVHNDYMIEEELLRKQMQSNLIDMQVGTFDNHLRIGNRIKQRVGFVIPTPPDERLDEEDYYHDDDRRAAGEDLTQFSWTVEKSNRLEHCPVELLAQLPEYARDSFEDEWTSSMTYEEKHKFAQTFLAKKHLELQNALVALEARQQVLAKLAIDFETKGREDYKAAVQEVTDRMVEKSGSSGQGPVNRRAATIKREKAAREKAGIKDGTATTIVRKNGNNKVEPSSGKNSKKTTEEVDDAKSKKHHSKKGTSSSSSRKNTSSKKEKESSSSRKSSSNSSKGKSKKKSASTASAAAASAAASFAEQMARLWTPTKSEDVGQEQEGEQGQGTTESVSGARNTTSATSSSATPLGGAGGGTTANPNGSRSPRPVRRLADRIQFLEETLRNMKLSAGRLSKLERLLFCVLFAIGLWLALVSVLRTCFGWCTTKSRSEEAAPLMSWWWWCSRSRTAINTSQQEALLAGEREKFRGLFYDSSDSEASSDYYDSDSDEDLQDEEERWEDGAKYENPPRPRAATTGLLCSITRRGGTSTTSDVLVVEDEAMASSSDEETVFEIANIIPEHKSS